MKAKIFTFFCILFLGFSNARGQGNYLKQIEKGEFSSVEKKINKGLEKEPNDVGLNFCLATLFLNRKFENYHPKKAYDLLIKTEKLYADLTNEKEIKRLNEVPINAGVISQKLDTVCQLALEDAIQKNSVEALDDFLFYFIWASTENKQKAVEKRDAAAFSNALKINSLDAFDQFLSKYPNAIQKSEAVKKRNSLAFSIANDSNTISAFENFINRYPNAEQANSASEKIHDLSYKNAEKINTIEAYEKFCNAYPNSKQFSLATSKIHELAYAEAEKLNTIESFQSFLSQYGNSKQYPKAKKILESKIFKEATATGNWISFRDFIEKYPDHSRVDEARDSIFSIGKEKRDVEALKYCIQNFSGDRRKNAFILFHDLFTMDGETITLDKFYEEYNDDLFEDIKTKDYALAELGDQLELHLGYDESQFYDYDSYIRKAAPNDRAFLALQNMIAEDIRLKNWNDALERINIYRNYFGDRHAKINDLLGILRVTGESSVKIQPFGKEINSIEGDEYIPTITADNKTLYFCGKNRGDNYGGEDVYQAKLRPSQSSFVVSDLSTSGTNDAPLSVSTDGTTIMLFIGGKLYTSNKMVNGWSQPEELIGDINEGKWQADAMVSSDGNALIFSSIRNSNYDYHTNNIIENYHGGGEFSSDIYVCLKNEDGGWGEAQNLGPVINTIYCDRSPFLHPDMKTLYFSSSGHGGLGGLDVFKSTRLHDSCWNCWSEPVNLGKEINTADKDWGYKITTDGNRAYFSKDKENGNSGIFWLNLPNYLRPDYVATISGKLLDKNNLPLSSEIRWEDLKTGKLVGKSKSNPEDGSYFIVLPMGKIYGYYVDKSDYFPLSNNLDLRQGNKAVQVENDISMVTFEQMINEGIAVPINNLFFDFGKYELLSYSIPELKRVSEIIKENKLKIEISGHTDNVGDAKSNLILSEYRANAVRDFLISEGCDASLLITKGYGKTKPVSTNETEVGRAKNRRVEMRFIK